MKNVLKYIEKYLLYTVVFLFPISFASISENPFVPAKLALLVFGVGTIVLAKSIRTILEGKLTWSVARTDFPVFLLVMAYVASTYFQTSNKMEALLLPGTTTAVVGGGLLYFFINQLRSSEKKNLVSVLFVSGVVYSILTLMAGLRLFQGINALPVYVQNPVFTPAGGYLPSVIFLLTILFAGIGLVFSSRDLVRQSAYAISSVVILFGLGFSLYNLIPTESNLAKGTGFRSPGFSTSWSVAVDSLKESPLLGVGSANYLTAFNRFRPLEYNLTDNWQFKFATAQNYYLTAMAETGMIGVAALVLLVLSVYRFTRDSFGKKSIKEAVTHPTHLGLVFMILALSFVPASTVVLVLLFVLLGLTVESSETELNLSAEGAVGKTSIAAFLITTPIIIFVGYVFYRSYRILAGEYTYRKALEYISENRGVDAYDTLRKAISLNPQVDRYHSRYSQVNLALANSLAGQAKDGQITEEQRAQITQLVQQAIREARFTVQLNLLRSNGWEQLARTYQAIAPLAQGAEVFASQSYRQAIQLDPINPTLRISLGQLHYAAGDYENAIDIFSLAVQVKPDLPNAYYNLAFALRENGDIDLARTAMTNVLANMDKNSPDYQVAVQALEDLDNLQQAEANVEELDAPKTAEEPVIEPQIELTNDDTPPAEPELSPAPTTAPDTEVNVSVTVTPQITPTPTP